MLKLKTTKTLNLLNEWQEFSNKWKKETPKINEIKLDFLEKAEEEYGIVLEIRSKKIEMKREKKRIEREIVEIEGIHLKEVSVAKKLFEFDKLVIISHFKGHPQAGFGGALKQLGIGCVAK